MAWSTFETRADKADTIRNLIGNLRTIHFSAMLLRDARALYLAGTDPTFNAIFDQMVNSTADRTELAAVIAQLTALVITDWEANHPQLLGLP